MKKKQDKRQEIERDVQWLREKMQPLDAGLHRPLALSGEILRTRLPEKPGRSRLLHWKAPLAAAMGAVVVVAGVLLAYVRQGSSLETAGMQDAAAGAQTAQEEAERVTAEDAPVKNQDGAADGAQGVAPAQNYEQIYAALTVQEAEQESMKKGNPALLMSSDARSGATAPPALSGGQAVPDRFKTDGEYLYAISYPDGQTRLKTTLNIVQAQTLEVLSAIELTDGYTGDLLLMGDRLAVFTTESGTLQGEETQAESGFIPSSSVRLYDIEDRAAPRLERTFTQSGDFVSARVDNGMLYLVSRQDDAGKPARRVADEKQPDPKSAAPRVLDSLTGQERALSPDSVFIPEGACEKSFAVVSVLALNASIAAEIQTIAVLGAGQTLLTENAFYCTYLLNTDQTGVAKFSAGGRRTALSASQTVDGVPAEGQPLYEREKTLYVATVNTNESFIYALGEDLTKRSVVSAGEGSPDVRFFGTAAYVGTAGREDGAAVVDLSSPNDLRSLGALPDGIPIPDQLFSLNGDLAVGLGETVSLTPDGVVQKTQLCLTLLDLSEPGDIRVLDTVLIADEGAYSPVLSDPRAAFVMEKGIGFPVETGSADENGNWQNASRFDLYMVRDGHLEKTGSASHGTENFDYQKDAIQRGALMGETLYTAADGEIRATDLAAHRETGRVALK